MFILKKLICLSIIFFAFCGIIFSQSLAVNLSVSWEKVQIEDNKEIVPILNIVYTNLSKESIYCKKISHSNYQFPPMYCNFLFNTEKRETPCEKAEQYINYKNKKFFVAIEGNWEVLDIIDDYNEEREASVFDCNFSDIYDCMKSKMDLEKNIKKNDSEDLIFLKEEEVHIDKYNLVAFQKIKGIYNFQIMIQTLGSEIIIPENYWSEEENRFIREIKALPEKIGDYSLYTGNFYSNELTIAFE